MNDIIYILDYLNIKYTLKRNLLKVYNFWIAEEPPFYVDLVFGNNLIEQILHNYNSYQEYYRG